jgi:hypothetical protein
MKEKLEGYFDIGGSMLIESPKIDEDKRLFLSDVQTEFEIKQKKGDKERAFFNLSIDLSGAPCIIKASLGLNPPWLSVYFRDPSGKELELGLDLEQAKKLKKALESFIAISENLSSFDKML